MHRAKVLAKRVLPEKIVERIGAFLFRLKFQRQQRSYDDEITRLKKTEIKKVVFFVIHNTIWKYSRLYELMDKVPHFSPVIVVCPFTSINEHEMHKEMDKTYLYFKKKGYNVIKSYKKNSERWVDVKKEIRPDIVFFSVPYSYTREDYLRTNFKNVLTCYVPYFFVTNGKSKNNYDSSFHNMVWKQFLETSIHKKLAEKYARNNGDNVIITGYPGLDNFLFKQAGGSDPWKIKDRNVKRIIWAPHHTIEGQGNNLNFSNFKRYAVFFKELTKKFKGKIQLAFKPHPLLKQKLYQDPEWGREQTNTYYNYYKKIDNGLLAESDYTDLFLSSDGLIHDCSSFMVEYLSTNNPSLYLLRDDKITERLNKFGRMALQKHYKAFNRNDILEYVKNIISGVDPMKEERERFVKAYLMPPGNDTASQNILNHIKSSIS